MGLNPQSNVFNLRVKYLFCPKRNLTFSLTFLKTFIIIDSHLDYSQVDKQNIQRKYDTALQNNILRIYLTSINVQF